MNSEWMMTALRCAAGIWCVWLVWMLCKTFAKPMETPEPGREEAPPKPEDRRAD